MPQPEQPPQRDREPIGIIHPAEYPHGVRVQRCDANGQPKAGTRIYEGRILHDIAPGAPLQVYPTEAELQAGKPTRDRILSTTEVRGIERMEIGAHILHTSPKAEVEHHHYRLEKRTPSALAKVNGTVQLKEGHAQITVEIDNPTIEQLASISAVVAQIAALTPEHATALLAGDRARVGDRTQHRSAS